MSVRPFFGWIVCAVQHVQATGSFPMLSGYQSFLWWNEKHIYSFLNEAKDSKLFIGVGEKEGFMVEDVMALYHRLPSVMDGKTAYYVADDENHASVVPATLSRAFRYFFT